MCLYYILVRLLKHCCNGNAKKKVNFYCFWRKCGCQQERNVQLVTEIQNRVPFALLSSNKNYFILRSTSIKNWVCVCVCVCVFYCPSSPASKSNFFCDVPYCHLCSVSLVFPHCHNRHTSRKKKLLNIEYVSIFLTTFVWNISQVKKNSAIVSLTMNLFRTSCRVAVILVRF